MTIKVIDLMQTKVIYLSAHQKLGHAKTLMKKNNLKTLPVVDNEEEVIGIISISDILNIESDNVEVKSVMKSKVYTVPQYENISTAATIMRNHKIHHLIVTHEKKLVGIVSSYDLLKLVEGKRFVMKNASTPKKSKAERNSLTP